MTGTVRNDSFTGGVWQDCREVSALSLRINKNGPRNKQEAGHPAREGRAGAKCAYVCGGVGGCVAGQEALRVGWSWPVETRSLHASLGRWGRGRPSEEMRFSSPVREFLGGASFHCRQGEF